MRGHGTASTFLAIKPVGQERWQLPKGTLNRNESSEQAALREVREEGGVEARIVGPLGAITYFFRSGSRKFRKVVDFYLMEYVRGDPNDHDAEVDEARWFSLEDISRLTFKSEQEVVERARKLWSSQPAADV
jgi:8-oxo-dGTP pyrophosphatase MutT (NUDIX family)